jgi:hypothetical protein
MLTYLLIEGLLREVGERSTLLRDHEPVDV